MSRHNDPLWPRGATTIHPLVGKRSTVAGSRRPKATVMRPRFRSWLLRRNLAVRAPM